MSAVLTPTAKLEYCKHDRSCSRKYTESFGRITMMLMDRFAREDNHIAVCQPHEWEEEAVDFLSSTKTWTSDELLKVWPLEL